MVYSGDPSAQTAEARVMRLKGYGNAIVPQQAADFVIAATPNINSGGLHHV
jgi:hypothetical protein